MRTRPGSRVSSVGGVSNSLVEDCQGHECPLAPCATPTNLQTCATMARSEISWISGSAVSVQPGYMSIGTGQVPSVSR
jgi:hypothetical protein